MPGVVPCREIGETKQPPPHAWVLASCPTMPTARSVKNVDVCFPLICTLCACMRAHVTLGNSTTTATTTTIQRNQQAGSAYRARRKGGREEVKAHHPDDARSPGGGWAAEQPTRPAGRRDWGGSVLAGVIVFCGFVVSTIVCPCRGRFFFFGSAVSRIACSYRR